jgi:hypothetical protein
METSPRHEDTSIQTFLPYPDFDRCAAVLDDRRLGKQRVETLQVMQVILRLRWNNPAGVIETFVPKGWRSHPCVLMWQEHGCALGQYQGAICDEWISRGFNDTCLAKTRGLLEAADAIQPVSRTPPPWLGDATLHLSHQSNLIRKDPDVYATVFPGVPPDLPYVWPVAVARRP